jgi:multimeric flavodoxin WrbA
MLRYLEKKLNMRIIDLLIAGTSIETQNMSPDWKSFFEKVKRFFAKWLEQMSKDLSPSQKKKLQQ